MIRQNIGRKGKELWTANGTGDKITFARFETGYEEANMVARMILKGVQGGFSYKDYVILYRTNAQSRLFEESFLHMNIPYKIVGGMNFYARKEIKDILAYLKTADNARDDLSLLRIINVPKRGIGDTTIARMQNYAADQGISLQSAVLSADEIPGIGRGAAKVREFAELVKDLVQMKERAKERLTIYEKGFGKMTRIHRRGR